MVEFQALLARESTLDDNPGHVRLQHDLGFALLVNFLTQPHESAE